jgi:hypothetical protein
MLVVADLEEVFVPLRDGLFVDPVARRSCVIPPPSKISTDEK